MQFKSLHPDFILPTKGSIGAAGYDLYLPEDTIVYPDNTLVKLGFAAAVPFGYVALMYPRSGVGSRDGLELTNTCGVIDSDFRGEWLANLRTKTGRSVRYQKGERILQAVLVPIPDFKPVLVDELPTTERGTGGFGSTGT